jgi:hypothetical protein
MRTTDTNLAPPFIIKGNWSNDDCIAFADDELLSRPIDGRTATDVSELGATRIERK